MRWRIGNHEWNETPLTDESVAKVLPFIPLHEQISDEAVLRLFIYADEEAATLASKQRIHGLLIKKYEDSQGSPK